MLVTGGTGYIGSHTVLSLLDAGASVVIVDNLCNSSATSLERVKELAGDKADRVSFEQARRGAGAGRSQRRGLAARLKGACRRECASARRARRSGGRRDGRRA